MKAALSTRMSKALRAMHSARPTFRTLIVNDAGRFTAVVNEHTMHALARRGLIEVDHVDTYPEPWVEDTVYYRLTEAGHAAAEKAAMESE